MTALLYRDPVLLDRNAHRGKRIRPFTDFSITSTMNAVFVAVTEFPEVGKEYVIGFVDAAGKPGETLAEVSPVALLGLRDGENLFVTADGRWDARYLPAFLRRYPLGYTASESGPPNVVVDAAWPGFNDSEGELLIEADGSPAPHLQTMIKFLDAFETEVQRTRRLCQRIVELELLKPVQIDVTMPGGEKLAAGGLKVIDEDKLKALPEATAAELLKNGALGLFYAHMMSSSNMPRLTERLSARLTAAMG